MTQRFTVGVEEEYLLVDRESGALRPRGERILPTAQAAVGAEVSPELLASQLEVGTPICGSLADVRGNLQRLRAAMVEAAHAHGSSIAALATHPFADWLGQGITAKARYEMLDELYQQLAREQVICGCHVHVAVEDRDVAVRVMDRMRPWLPVLLALSANSPFWEGVDTGYASYRTMLFDRWPTSGAPAPLGSRKAYDDVVEALVRVNAIADASNLYWDVRPSSRYETVEVRVADVCLTIEDAVLVAGLCRSLVRTLLADVADAQPFEPARPELIRAARWRAARFGLRGQLIDVVRVEEVPASTLVERLLELCRPDLEAHDEWREVSERAEHVLVHGNGADRQRQAFERTGSLAGVVEDAVGVLCEEIGCPT